jgi:DNA-directed RNA polymerase specialized sigma24 family protein
MTGERVRAQDAVHQVFLKLIENGNLGSVIDKKAYLFACLLNAILNETKLQRRNTDLDPESVWFNPPNRDYAGEQNLRRAIYALSDCSSQLRLGGWITN